MRLIKRVSSTKRVIQIDFSQNVTTIDANTQAGTHILSIGDWEFPYTAVGGNTAPVLLEQIRAAIHSDGTLPFEVRNNAITSGTTLDITFAIESTEWNDLVVSDSGGLMTFRDTAGTGVPQYKINTNIGDTDDDTFVLSDNGNATITALKTELDRRWGANVNLDGHAIDAFKGTLTDINAHLADKNSEHISTLCVPATTKAPSFLLAAALAGVASREFSLDPARPLNTLVLRGVKATRGIDFNIGARDTILTEGGSTSRKQPSGELSLERVVTNYTENVDGVADNSYTDIMTPYSLMYIKRRYNSELTSKFGRTKLVDGDTFSRVTNRPGTTTLNEVKITFISIYDDLIEEGIVENKEFFASTLVVEKDTTDPTRVNVVMQPDLVNSLQQFNVTIRFALEA